MFAEMIEAADRAPARRPLYLLVLMGTMLAILAISAVQFLGTGAAVPHTDYDVFHIAGRLVWSGEMAEAYDMASLMVHEKAMLGTAHKIAWTYPPPYNLLIAPLGLMSLPMGFMVFMTLSLGAYLWTLSRLAGDRFATLLVLMLVPVYVVIVVGQNGFVTGTLIGLACLGLRDRKAWAGIPLGLMIIKPHLAIGLAVYVVVSRQWRVFFVAAATVLAACGAATLVFGPAIWTAFLGGVQETATLLQSGKYPIYRMLSPYATLGSLGVPAGISFGVQAVSAVLALAAIIWAHLRLPVQQALGVTVVASMLITPYVYDYDIPVLGVGLALLLPDLVARGRPGERGLLYACFLFMAGYGFVRLAMLNIAPLPADAPWPPTVAGAAMLLCLAIVVRVFGRAPLAA